MDTGSAREPDHLPRAAERVLRGGQVGGPLQPRHHRRHGPVRRSARWRANATGRVRARPALSERSAPHVRSAARTPPTSTSSPTTPTRSAAHGRPHSIRTMFPCPTSRKLTRPLSVAERTGRALPRGRKQIWVTEFSWDSSPPDPHGVPIVEHAHWLEEALYVLWHEGVDAVAWYLIVDQPPIPNYADLLPIRCVFPRRASEALDAGVPVPVRGRAGGGGSADRVGDRAHDGNGAGAAQDAWGVAHGAADPCVGPRRLHPDDPDRRPAAHAGWARSRYESELARALSRRQERRQ